MTKEKTLSEKILTFDVGGRERESFNHIEDVREAVKRLKKKVVLWREDLANGKNPRNLHDIIDEIFGEKLISVHEKAVQKNSEDKI